MESTLSARGKRAATPSLSYLGEWRVSWGVLCAAEHRAATASPPRAVKTPPLEAQASSCMPSRICTPTRTQRGEPWSRG